MHQGIIHTKGAGTTKIIYQKRPVSDWTNKGNFQGQYTLTILFTSKPPKRIVIVTENVCSYYNTQEMKIIKQTEMDRIFTFQFY